MIPLWFDSVSQLSFAYEEFLWNSWEPRNRDYIYFKKYFSNLHVLLTEFAILIPLTTKHIFFFDSLLDFILNVNKDLTVTRFLHCQNENIQYTHCSYVWYSPRQDQLKILILIIFFN